MQGCTYGAALGSAQLNATATAVVNGGTVSVPGSFVYSPAAGTVLPPGYNDALTVTFTPTDATDFTTANGSTTIHVNAPPTVGSITAPLAPAQISSAITVSASFSDPNVLDTHTALWSWGDTTTSPGTVSEANGAGSVAGNHTYTVAGAYTLTLTVTDNLGASGQSSFQYVVAYDPSGGFVTGGGWINSPAGAYVANPALTGKANFGFDSRYKKGANVPAGNTQFSLKVANLDFHSTSYDWLAVAGAKAQYAVQGIRPDQ